MPDTVQTQVQRDILPWLISIRWVDGWTIQPFLKLYRCFAFIGQMVIVLGGIGISFPVLNALSAIAGKEGVPPPAKAEPAAPVAGGQSSAPKSDGWVLWMQQFATGQHGGLAMVMVLGWAGLTAAFRMAKMAERSVLVKSLQEEGRKLDKDLLDCFSDTEKAQSQVQQIKVRLNNLINTHIGPRSYPKTEPFKGTEAVATQQIAGWMTNFPDVPWATPLQNMRRP